MRQSTVKRQTMHGDVRMALGILPTLRNDDHEPLLAWGTAAPSCSDMLDEGDARRRRDNCD